MANQSSAGEAGVVMAYVGIGSNLDDPRGQVCAAIDALHAMSATDTVIASSLYGSKPMGPQDQPDYINAVAGLPTRLQPLDLLHALQGIEQHHKRVRGGERWGARTLDLDLLLYGAHQWHSPELTVPHPGLHARAFVLYPLREIASPDLVVPGQGRLEQLIERCPADGLWQLNKCDESRE